MRFSPHGKDFFMKRLKPGKNLPVPGGMVTTYTTDEHLYSLLENPNLSERAKKHLEALVEKMEREVSGVEG